MRTPPTLLVQSLWLGLAALSHYRKKRRISDKIFLTVVFSSFPSFPSVRSCFGCGFAALRNPQFPFCARPACPDGLTARYGDRMLRKWLMMRDLEESEKIRISPLTILAYLLIFA
jgi:hypothetical protein